MSAPGSPTREPCRSSWLRSGSVDSAEQSRVANPGLPQGQRGELRLQLRRAASPSSETRVSSRCSELLKLAHRLQVGAMPALPTGSLEVEPRPIRPAGSDPPVRRSGPLASRRHRPPCRRGRARTGQPGPGAATGRHARPSSAPGSRAEAGETGEGGQPASSIGVLARSSPGVRRRPERGQPRALDPRPGGSTTWSEVTPSGPARPASVTPSRSGRASAVA